jgi:hypothetical protein
VMVEGMIVVPDGKSCELLGTTVTESIRVGIGSTLIARGIEVLKPGTVSIQAYGATRIEVTGQSVPGETGELEELRTSLLGGMQAVAGGTVIVADTELDGGLQALNNSGPVEITGSFAEGAVELSKNRGGVSVKASFLGEGVEISETTGDVSFAANTSDQSDLTIGKTNGDVTVRDNPSLGENFEVSETSGLVSVLDNTINDNADISRNAGGAIVSGNTVGDSLALFKITGGPVTFMVPCDPLDPECTVLGVEVQEATMIVVENTVGDNIALLETGGADGEVIFTANVVEGTATIDKSTGQVTANDNWLGYQPPESPEPGAEPEPVAVPELPSGGSLLVSEASEGANVQDNTLTNNLDVTENLLGTTVSDNTVGVGIVVSKNKGGTEVSANRAGGGIECKDNDPAATGGGNLAGADGGSGSLTGECAGL